MPPTPSPVDGPTVQGSGSGATPASNARAPDRLKGYGHGHGLVHGYGQLMCTYLCTVWVLGLTMGIDGTLPKPSVGTGGGRGGRKTVRFVCANASVPPRCYCTTRSFLHEG